MRSKRLLAGGLASLAAITAPLLFASTAEAQSDRGNQAIEAALQLTPDMGRGKSTFRKLCSSCHGESAEGSKETVIPALAGQLPIYIIKQMVDLSEGHRIEATMHRVLARKELTSEQSIRDIASYLGKLPRVAKPEVGDGDNLAVGRKYYDGLCSFCHGALGDGNEEHATPVLAQQHYSYLLLQMKDLSQGHRYSVDISVLDALQALPPDTLKAVADYAARLPSSSRTTKHDGSRP